MATFNVEIDLGNSAFEDSSEVARILRNLADRVEIQVIAEEVTHNGGDYPLKDINGNRVGSAWIQEDLAMGHTAENDALLAVLNAHGEYKERRTEEDLNIYEAVCLCGEVLTDTSNGPFFDQRHRAHQAAMLARIIPSDKTI